MPVKDFIPVDNVKKTIEKPVSPRKTTDELTTVISPGKPSPASLLEPRKARKTTKKTKKRVKRKTRAKSSLVSIAQPKKDSVLIVTEKPQAAQKIALALSPSASKYTENNVPYFSLEKDGNKIIVASAVGHLFNLTYKKGQTGWPIFETQWVPSYNQKNAAFTKRYYDLLKKLSKKAKEIIIATDFDVEGEVIGWNVLRFICGEKTAKRMKYSTLTKKELQESYEKPLSEPAWGQAYAGESRHIADWLYGINLSRALMSAIKTQGTFKILSIGRVQGPALKIIVDREREIESFKSKPYWQVFAIVGKNKYKHPQDIFDKKDLEAFKKIKKAEAETKIIQESLAPPHPLDLTTLQREAYRLHRISPSNVLKIAQKLYLQGLISYPRTSSQKIPESIEPKKILKSLSAIFPEALEAKRPKPVEGLKNDPAHPSIYPTGEFPGKLESTEEKVYLLVAKRFISCFSADAKLERKRTTLVSKENKKLKFTASGLKVLEKGWTKVYPAVLEEKALPDINGLVDIDKIEFEEKETQPPKRYTPTSLISTLEKKNLGTKATRSSIVDTLFDRGYLDGRSIKATPLGLKLIEALEQHSPIIIDENLTRTLEEEMEDILNASKDLEKKSEKVVEKVKTILSDISKEFKTKEPQIGEELKKAIQGQWEKEKEDNTLTTCPTCKKGNLRILYSRKTKRYFVSCSAYPDCTQTYSLPPNSLIKPSGKQCESCQFPKLLAIRKGRKPWEFCFNKECEINKKRLEEYRKKQEN